MMYANKIINKRSASRFATSMTTRKPFAYRQNFNVAFARKDAAKALGAQWDADKKVWFAPSADIKTALVNAGFQPEVKVNQPFYAFLNVPFDLKEMAKELGARWNPDKSSWFAPTRDVFDAVTNKLNALTNSLKSHVRLQAAPVMATPVAAAPVAAAPAAAQPWLATGETEQDYKNRYAMGSYYKGVFGGVPDPAQYQAMKKNPNGLHFIDTRGD